MDVSIVIFSTGLLIFIAHLFANLFERTRIPDVLPLIIIGLMIGPGLGLVQSEFFGQIGSVFVSITLVIILFGSGIDLKFSTLRESLGGGVKLTVINFILTGVVMTIASVGIGLTLLEGMILGAILGGTSSAVVIPLVEKIKLQNGSKAMLLLESTFSDVLCIVVTLALLQSATSNHISAGNIVGQIISSFLVAAIIGGLFALAWSSILSSIRRLDNSIFLTPAFVFITYGITESLGFSGAISALTMGITLGNIREIVPNSYHELKLPFDDAKISLRPISLNQIEKMFIGEIIFLLKTFFFVYIGISIALHNTNLSIIGLLLTLVIFSVRILVVRLSMNKTILKRDAILAAVISPKGLAAAVLATLPAQAGLAGGVVIQDVVYAIILFSIISTASLSFLIERSIIRRPYEDIFSNYAIEKPTTQ